MENRRYGSHTKQQLAIRFNVSMTTFKKWLDKVPELKLSKFQKVLTPKEVETICKHLGDPPE